VASVELPGAQHAFDVLASVRCRHTTMGVVRFLDGVRADALDVPTPARPAVVGPNAASSD